MFGLRFTRLKKKYTINSQKLQGPGSSVGIATELHAGRSGDRIPVGARFSAPVQTGPGTHPASCTMGTGSFSGVKSGRCVTLTPYSLLVPLVMKEQSYTSTPPMDSTACTEPQYSYTSTPTMGRTACTEPQCLYKGDLYLYLFIINFGTIIINWTFFSCQTVYHHHHHHHHYITLG